MFRVSSLVFLISLVAAAQTPRPTPPTRDPNTAGYVKAKELSDGEIPSPKEDGNFIIGSTHSPAKESTA